MAMSSSTVSLPSYPDSDYAEIFVVRHGKTAWNSEGRVQVVKDLDLRERHMGDLQGLRYRELSKTNPIAYEALVSKDDERELPGGGESFVQLFERCKSALLRIGRKHKGKRVVVVTHGACIETLYKWSNAKGSYAGKIDNTSVAVFELYGEDNWTLKMWGDVSHLTQKAHTTSV
ncbi:phosphoglycerate mutase-like protein 4 isoform X2 [Vigna radiata var. radiata]|uniref:Phosphoglycerate mutase-like protein 4 isoform X2 n=1 Tax=Vigna radiata var. radiata TaxID=3916 RepID=A0A3Q0F4T9_VIGRR|nr:phosphoglycerate mutase-like protein 4 isoform X2 [Vigna radiata var. radiata]